MLYFILRNCFFLSNKNLIMKDFSSQKVPMIYDALNDQIKQIFLK